MVVRGRRFRTAFQFHTRSLLKPNLDAGCVVSTLWTQWAPVGVELRAERDLRGRGHDHTLLHTLLLLFMFSQVRNVAPHSSCCDWQFHFTWMISMHVVSGTLFSCPPHPLVCNLFDLNLFYDGHISVQTSIYLSAETSRFARLDSKIDIGTESNCCLFA